ncbi:formimidoylglutamate deiminase [Nocardioides nanhaiensis]|uniref:Formimidoylglutamate deiminase n=1 Tax=Nocardioides nanhaiensis TaxID=1476871 RepID=A0ABP8VR46_9ACTN
MAEAYTLERAWVGGAVRDQVVVEVEAGRFTRVDVGGGSAGTPLPGLTIPGLANCHSHAFHRALRGRTQRGGGTFWTWREQMYALAGALDPRTYQALATAVFREMAAAGITAVGEFHYLHHQPGGAPYGDPQQMDLVLVQAARTVGVRLTLLDTCYLAAGFGEAPAGAQLRFGDDDADAWAERFDDLVERLAEEPGVVVGAAVHSVRAVPADQLATVAQAAAGRPLHVHLSEQPAENEACLAAHGLTPTGLLAERGVLGPLTTAVHATHLTDDDVALLGTSGTHACFCPTTERDLADGVGPSRALHEAGSPLTLGSDSHAVVDLFEEMRAVELHERLVSGRRGHWSAAELLDAATAVGHASLGFADAGEIAVGRRADLVTLTTDGPATAGTGADEHTAVFAATAADVVHVVADGRVVHTAAQRPEVGALLAEAVAAAWQLVEEGAR